MDHAISWLGWIAEVFQIGLLPGLVRFILTGYDESLSAFWQGH